MSPDIYESDNYMVLDFETNSGDKGDALNPGNSMVLAVWYLSRTGTTKYCYKNEFEQAELVRDLESVDFLVAHNAKFELQWLERCGYQVNHRTLPVFDTMIAEKVLWANRPKPLGLGNIAARRGISGKDALVSTMISNGVDPSDIPKELLLKYCEQDVLITNEVFQQQLRELKLSGQLPVLYTRCLLTPVLADIEADGIALDAERVAEAYQQTLVEFREVEAQINKFTGGINPRSPKQKAEFLFGTLGFDIPTDYAGRPRVSEKTGLPRTDAETLSKLRPKTKQQKEYVELQKKYNQLNSTLTKTLTKFQACCDEDDGILYASFNQTRTNTDRLSSTGKKHGVQFQNMARVWKNLITTRHEDYYIVEADGAQLEFRTAAYLGQDPVACQDILDDYDIHKFTASILNNVPESRVTKEQRQDAKTHTFKPLYGGLSGTKAQVKYYSEFRKKYSRIYAAQEGWVDEVIRTGKLVTPWGHIFYWPDTKVTETGYVTNTTSIYNYPVQSLATAEIIPIALAYVWRELKARGMRSFIVNTVHDSVIAEVHKDEIDEFREICIDSFTNKVYTYLSDIYGIKFNVPLGIGFTIGKHWTEGEEEKYTTIPEELVTDE